MSGPVGAPAAIGQRIPGNGTCEHCGAKNVALVGLHMLLGRARRPFSTTGYDDQKPACSWCCRHDEHGAPIELEILFDEDDFDEPTQRYSREIEQVIVAEREKSGVARRP